MGYSQNSLTSCIYDMALGRSNWDSILDILAAAFPGCLVLISGHDLAQRKSLLFAQRGLQPAAVTAYLSSYADFNPWIGGMGDMVPFQVFHSDQIVPPQEAAETAFCRDWLLKQGDYINGTGVVILRQGARQMAIEIRYPANDPATRERASLVLGEAAYHFGRAFEILRRARFPEGIGYLDSVVEELPFAVFFVDASMKIQYANQHAETLRRANDGPFSGIDGVLRAHEGDADQRLRELIEKSISPKRQTASVLQLDGPSGDRYLAMARQAARGTQHYELHDAILNPAPLVMLVVHGTQDGTSLPMDLLWRAFALTESEASLAEALLNGATLADYAQDREVSKQTLRNQLVGIMRKTGTKRQAELVSLLTRLSLTCV